MSAPAYTRAEDFLGKTVTATIERPLGSVHPKHANIIYGVNYGFVPDTLSPDGGELDVYVLGVAEPLATFTGYCLAILRRTQDDDDKLILVPAGKTFNEAEIRVAVDFQEKFFESHIIFA
ncbi:MAG: inorganic diphosphatase [Bdellovibrionales bacterium]